MFDYFPSCARSGKMFEDIYAMYIKAHKTSQSVRMLFDVVRITALYRTRKYKWLEHRNDAQTHRIILWQGNRRNTAIYPTHLALLTFFAVCSKLIFEIAELSWLTVILCTLNWKKDKMHSCKRCGLKFQPICSSPSVVAFHDIRVVPIGVVQYIQLVS